MKIWKFKNCPRCAGDVFIDTDEEKNWYAQCLQCGFVRHLQPVKAREEEPVVFRRKRQPARRD